MISVTPNHAVLVDGRFLPAREARPGQTLQTLQGAGEVRAVPIQRIVTVTGRVVNPITHSGRILAGRGQVLVATAPYLPHNWGVRFNRWVRPGWTTAGGCLISTGCWACLRFIGQVGSQMHRGGPPDEGCACPQG